LFNDVTSLSWDLKVDFCPQNINKGKQLIRSITKCLWAIDGNQNQINKASNDGKCKHLPHLFSDLCKKKYNDWEAKKIAKPHLSGVTLRELSDEVFDVLCLWKCFPHKQFYDGCKQLAECLRSYSDYLKKCSDSIQQTRFVYKKCFQVIFLFCGKFCIYYTSFYKKPGFLRLYL